MPELLLKVCNVSKTYSLDDAARETFKDEIIARAKGFFKSNLKSKLIEFNALQNISFELERGDVLGVIGENGAGKSTLLKILSEITTPTEGTIEFYGRTTSILEIGTGFHPDLTGRENIYFNGSLMGLSAHEIDDKYESIVDFSGVREFIDTPVKHYSTGMYIRLAFSVSVQLNADIMLLDEVSSVGDVEFRMKSLNRIKELASDSGVSAVLVTHNLNDVLELCNKCMILEKGKIKALGDPIAVTREYYQGTIVRLINAANDDNERIGAATKAANTALITDKMEKEAVVNDGQGVLKTPLLFWRETNSAPGNETIRISLISVHAAGKTPEVSIHMQDSLEVDLKFWKLRHVNELEISMILNDQIGNPVFTTSSIWDNDTVRLIQAGLYNIKISIPGYFLNYGLFSLTFAFSENMKHIVAKFDKLIYFIVKPDENETSQFLSYETPGPLRPKLKWEVVQVASENAQ